MTREQQYIQEQYMRRQQLLRNYAKVASFGYDEEEQKKREPRSESDIRNGIADTNVNNISIKDDITLNGTGLDIVDERTLTLELGSSTLSSGSTTDDYVIDVKNGGTLVINNNSNLDGDGKIESGDNAWAAIKLTKADEYAETKTATLVINGGTFNGKYYAVTGHGQRHNTSVTINDGILSGRKGEDSAAIYQPQKGNLTINGGTFYGDTTLYIKSGTTVINGGTFYATGISDEYEYNNNGFNNTGDCLVVDSCIGYNGGDPINLSVFGGTFYSENAKPIAAYCYGTGKSALSNFVYGGKFNKELDASVIAEGYEQNFDGEMWVVSAKPTL